MELNEIEKEIEKVKAEREKVEQESAQARREKELQFALEKEERGLANDRAFVQAEEELGVHGVAFGFLEAPDGRGLIFKRPDLPRTRMLSNKKNAGDEDFDKYIVSCLHYPSLGEYRSILKEFPLIQNKALELIGELGGNSEEVRKKKLKS